MKTIIEMAREAGIDAETDTLCRYEGWVEPLERFANLIRADEREACAKVCETQAGHGPAYENWWEFAAAIRTRSDK